MALFSGVSQFGFVGGDVQDGVAVDLGGAGAGVGDADAVAGQDGGHVLQFHVFAFEDLGEVHQGLQLGGAVVDDDGELIGEAVLAGGDHHAAAVITAFHGRGEPDVVEFMLHAVHFHDRVAGLEVEEQALDGDAGVVDLLAGRFFLDLIRRLAAVAVDAEAHVVDEFAFQSVHAHGGQILQIFVQRDLVPGLFADVVEEIVARAVAVQIDVVL